MEEIRALRDQWQAMEAQEVLLQRRMSVQESIRSLLALQRAFEQQLQQTESLFRAERQAYLQNLQARLQQFDRWYRERYGEPASVDCHSAETPG
jgi:hypothetical protein